MLYLIKLYLYIVLYVEYIMSPQLARDALGDERGVLLKQ